MYVAISLKWKRRILLRECFLEEGNFSLKLGEGKLGHAHRLVTSIYLSLRYITSDPRICRHKNCSIDSIYVLANSAIPMS